VCEPCRTDISFVIDINKGHACALFFQRYVIGGLDQICISAWFPDLACSTASKKLGFESLLAIAVSPRIRIKDKIDRNSC
jgi:hypothetical protein